MPITWALFRCRPRPRDGALAPWQQAHAIWWKFSRKPQRHHLLQRLLRQFLMFANIIRHHLHVRNASAFRADLLSRRQFSVLLTHASFPATLYRFQTQRSSGLLDYKESGDVENGLELSADGLVRPMVSDVPCRWCNPFLPSSES